MQVPTPPRMRSFERGVLFTAILCLLTMPVDYRGGAEQSHPHSGLQFLAEAAGGTLVHHHDGSHHHQTPEQSPDDASLRMPAEQETPSFTTATVAQKYAPIAIAAATGLYGLTLGARTSRSRFLPARITGLNPAPTPPPPRLAGVI